VNGRLGALVVAILLLSVVVLVAAFAGGGGDTDPRGRTDGEALAMAEGVLTQVAQDALVLQPFAQGAPPLRFAVRPGDVAVLDLPHLRQHVQDGTPVRLYYERSGGTTVAKGYEDLLGGPAG